MNKLLRYRMGRRRGAGLITVVLVGAILMLSAMMFVNQLAAEGRITKTDAAFKSALSLAESGLTETLSMMRAGVDPAGNANPQYWAQLLSSHSATVGPVVDTRVHGTYVTDFTVVTDTAVDLRNDASAHIVQHTASVDVVATGAVYPPSVTSMG